MSVATAPPPEMQDVPRVSPFKLLMTLGVAGALAGLLLVTVYEWTQPRIEAYRAKMLKAAVLEVLGGPQSYTTLYVVDGALTPDLPDGADARSLDQVYMGVGADGGPDGFAVPAAKSGYQDVISVLFGFDPSTGTLRGMKVLSHKETPGLGDAIEKDEAFYGQFDGRKVPLVGVKAGTGAGGDAEIDMITGATISSRCVVNAINEALEKVQPLIEAYEPAGGAGQ
jgi:electron transport complex protein RnfG